jgi:hypothetical protein
MFGLGGKDPPPGKPQRAKAPKKPEFVSVQVKLEPAQKDKLALLGGDAWLREQIDKAKWEPPFSS